MKLTKKQLRKLILEAVWDSGRYKLDDWDLQRAADEEVRRAEIGDITKMYPGEAIRSAHDHDFFDINFPYAKKHGPQGEEQHWQWSPEKGWHQEYPAQEFDQHLYDAFGDEEDDRSW